MGNVPKEASPRGGRPIGYLVLSTRAETRRAYWAGLWFLFLAAFWAAIPAQAQQTVRLELGYEAENLVPPEALLGEWQAVLKRNGKPQPVFLSIKAVSPGKTAGKMTFTSPRRCFIDLEYGGPDRGRHIFYMIRFTNCFDYEPHDFISLSHVPGEDIAELIAADSEKPSRKAAEPGDADPAVVPLTGLERIVYAISLDGDIQDSAILKRQ